MFYSAGLLCGYECVVVKLCFRKEFHYFYLQQNYTITVSEIDSGATVSFAWHMYELTYSSVCLCLSVRLPVSVSLSVCHYLCVS